MDAIDQFTIGKTLGLTNNEQAIGEYVVKINRVKEKEANEVNQAIANMEAGGQRVIDIYKAGCQQAFNTLDTIREKTEAMLQLLMDYSKKLTSEDPKISKLADNLWNAAQKNFEQTLQQLQAADPLLLEKIKTASETVATTVTHFHNTLTTYEGVLKKAHADTEQLYKGVFVGNALRTSVKEEV